MIIPYKNHTVFAFSDTHGIHSGLIIPSEADRLLSLFDHTYHFKAYGATAKGYPKHHLFIENNAKLKKLEEIGLAPLAEKINCIFKKNKE